LFFRVLLFALGDPDVPVRHRTVIALEHERTQRFFVVERRGSRRAGHFTILVDHDTVVNDLYELGVRDFLTALVEPGRTEDNVECLPLARFF
jgi:hypothetical protein